MRSVDLLGINVRCDHPEGTGQTVGSLALLGIAALYSLVMAGLYIFVFGGMTGVSPEGESFSRTPGTVHIVVSLSFVFWTILAVVGSWERSLALVWVATSIFTIQALILVFSLGLVFLPAVPILIIGAILATNMRKSPIPIKQPSV